MEITRAARPDTSHWQARLGSSAVVNRTLDSPVIREDKVSKAARRSTNFNLQKSLLLLDETVGTPGGSSILRVDKSDSKGRSFATPRNASGLTGTPGLNFDTTLGTSKQSLSFRDQTKVSLMEDEDEVTTTNVQLLLQEDPGLAGSSSIFSDFKKQLRQHPAEHQIFDLLAQYEDVCNLHVSVLDKLLRKTTPAQLKFKKVERTLNGLNEEKHTWRLIRFLCGDRLESVLKQTEEEHMEEDRQGDRQGEGDVLMRSHLSDKDIVQKLYEKDATVRQAQLVVDWLESACAEKLDTYYERVEFFQDKAVAWENMLHTLKQSDMGVPLYSDRQYISEMDPDAPMRQRKSLNDQDQEDEGRLLRYLFACVRAGQLDDAQKLCVRCGQSWRSATLEGWRLYHDPNYGESHPLSLKPVEGNYFRDIWKVSCWRLSENEQFDRFERAIYGALSGNIKQVLPICENWSDYVWAYFKSMVDTRVEQEIRLNSPSHKTHEELPKHFWDKVMSPESIFRDIHASTNDAICSEGKERFHVIQKYIILGDFAALVEEMFEWVTEVLNRPNRHLVRFMAHLVLFLQAIGANTKEELSVTILESYVRDLIEDKQIPLVATYVSKLPQELQVNWYAEFLQDIHDADDRRLCLELAAEAGLDIPSITKQVVENIRSQDSSEIMGMTEMPSDPPVSQEDKEKINAIDWLLFDESQRSEAMVQANAIMRTFLVQRKYAAARSVFDKLPSNSVDVIAKTWLAQTGSTDLPLEMENCIREYLCLQAYLEAQDSFNNWFEHYHNGKPAKPEMEEGGNFADRVAHEHREAQFQAETERWQHGLNIQSKRTIAQIYNVLLFPDGGWMVDRGQELSMDSRRLHQMQRLRRMCLPTMCFLARTVLHSTQQYQECLQLADAIADDTYQLYAVFQKEDLQKFSQELAKSAIEHLNQNKDALGYPSS